MFERKKTKEERNKEKYYSMTDEEIIEAKERLEKEPLFEPYSNFSTFGDRTSYGKTQFSSFFEDVLKYAQYYGGTFTKEMDDDVIKDRLRQFQSKERTKRPKKDYTLTIIIDKPPYKSIYDSMETETIQFEMI